ncbi:hypothetical protein LJC57_03860 [Parabacteroides sp. OttesenSCG-928-G07]|nr:hypothetical protein [Parabacteroides sp. OttesenSCG-928-G21]MDL2277706.1 hypothetical protein [Parabacteroides sp. OttesenSCG-928-G07]
MAKKKKTAKLSLFENLNNWLDKRQTVLFWVIFGITLLTGLLLYDPRVSLAGDDSSYILRADDFLQKFIYPSYQGPLYPLALSIVLLVFGFNLMPLKLFSLAAILGFLYFTWRAFRNRVPTLLIFSVLILVSINAHLLYYGSQTFSEAFYMFMQSLVLLIFFSAFIGKEGREEAVRLPQDIKRHLLLALVVLMLALTRSVGYSIMIAVAGYFVCYRQWKNLGLFLTGFALLFVLYAGITTAIWEGEIIPSSQGGSLLNKDFYRPELGKEDAAGLLIRFVTNSRQYLSGNLYNAMGLVEVSVLSYPLMLLTYLMAIVTLVFSYKKNRYIFFATLVTGLFLFTTFIILQASWNQQRLIIPVYPYILFLLLGACYYLLELKKTRSWQFVFLLPVIVLFFAGVSDAKEQVVAARKIKTEFDGLTPDWRNYTKASRWVGDKLNDPSVLVACRKPEISTIYANGKPFHGIYSVPSTPLDEFIQQWKTSSFCYVLYDKGRENTEQHLDLILSNYEGVINFDTGGYFIARYEQESDIPPVLWEDNLIRTPEALLKVLSDTPCSIYLADYLLSQLKEAGVTHILLANLRFHSWIKDGETISTVRNYLTFFTEKYPYSLKLEYQEGADEDEPAYIFSIDWENL